ncbi:hypothetical protein GCM10015535_63010 [Streptomyces gelaticus]|uniref:Uncharacterized protein n=1 Tax=Streptomyces gelaticus TaxID=285446 RepID=A0ABQ2W7E2_9ACTN|nr:hypothetical protein GCM10015535_63010 [Streptomyces gelaticus]
MCQELLSTAGPAVEDGWEGAAAVAGPADDDTAPAVAAAASAAVSTVLREVGRFMGETPGRKRNEACRCTTVRQLLRVVAGSGQRFDSRR